MEMQGQKRPRQSSSGDKNPRPQKTKKQQFEKLRDARKIAVQSSSATLVSGSLDVNSFTSARSFEISALEKAMRSSKSALAQRAFQDVPRNLRRRSASHNVKRVPRPLRAKATREMIADGTKTTAKIRGPKRLRMEKRRLTGKSGGHEECEDMVIDEESDKGVPKLKPRKVAKEKFAYRQEDKTWLPTHMYHAKRARVEPRYGFSLPITPTEKSFRPTYRASHQSGFIAFDTSYYSTLFLHGSEDALRRLLDMIIEPGSAASAKRYSSGKRSCETTFYHHEQFPRGMIGPGLVVWNASQDQLHQVMLRIHPAILGQVWEELHICAKTVDGITIEDARFDIGAIDLFGPLATEALFAILKVGKGPCSKAWQHLRGLGEPASLPMGALLNLDLCDPRIAFPPRKVKQAQSPDLFSLIKEWPKHLPGSAKLFNQSFRSAAVIYLDNHSRGSLQKAQNDLLSEGKPPTLPPSEPIIPSMLLRRDSGAWTLLLPWSWVTEFWYSFMHYPQSRFGGLTEYAQISFEKHGMAFPEDWPGTIAGDTDGIRMAAQVKEKWNRRQDGKRESWGKVHTTGNGGEVGDPFKCDWNMLFKKEVSAPETSVDGEAGLVESIRNQAKAAMGSSADDNTVQATHFMLSPGYAKQLITRKSPLLSTNDLSAALLPIRLRFLQKGNVSFRARIYRLPEAVEERQKWTNLLSKDESNPSKQDYPRCPGERDLLGFVTTGNMSLSEGRGRAVGALSWARAELEEERWADEKEFGRWCIVRDVGKDIARLTKWEIND